jgi:hypothetical protein
MSIIRVLPEIVAVVRVKTSAVTAVVVAVEEEEEEEEEEEGALQSLEVTEKFDKLKLNGTLINTLLPGVVGA